MTDGSLLRTLKGHTNEVRSVAFSPDGETLATGSSTWWDSDLRICLWSVADGSLLQPCKKYSNVSCTNLAFSPDAGKLAFDDRFERRIHVRSVADHRHLQSWEGYILNTIEFSPDGRTLAIGGYNSEVAQSVNVGGTTPTPDWFIALWSVIDGKPQSAFKGHSDSIESVAFSPDGGTLGSGSKDKTVRLWSVADGQPLHVLRGHTESVDCVAFSPDGQTIASGSGDKTVRLWGAP
jgi:WD40 repeat protein